MEKYIAWMDGACASIFQYINTIFCFLNFNYVLHIVHCIFRILYFFIQEEDKGHLLVLRIEWRIIFIQKADLYTKCKCKCTLLCRKWWRLGLTSYAVSVRILKLVRVFYIRTCMSTPHLKHAFAKIES